MKVEKAVSVFRSKLAQAGYEDDNTMSDELIYKLLSDAVAIVFTRYKDKYQKISDWMFSTYGVKIVEVDEDVFSCETLDSCKILESENVIPESITARNKIMFKVYHNNQELPEYQHVNKFDDYLKNKPSWSIFNQKLRIHNDHKIKAVTVKTIPADAMAWVGLKYCPETDTTDCYSLDEIEFPLMNDPKMQSMCYDLALQSLGLTLNEMQQEPNQNKPH